MEILGTSTNPMELVPDYLSSAQNGTVGTENGAMAGSAGAPGAGGDTVNFSQEALQLSALGDISVFDAADDKMTAAKATGKVGSADVSVTSAGVVTWGSTKLDLSGTGFTNVIIQADGANFNVFDASDTSAGVRLGSNGKKIEDPATAYVAANDSLVVLKSGGFDGTDADSLLSGNGMIVNLASNSGAAIDIKGGAGDASIFNFAATVGTITATTGAGGGNIRTIGISAGTLEVGNGASGTLTVVSNMNGGTIKTNGDNFIEADKFALNNVTINATKTDSKTEITAKTIKNDSLTTGGITLGNGANKIEVGNMINAEVKGGDGIDTVIINGKSTGNEIHLGDGNDVLEIKGVAKDTIITYTDGENTTSAKSGNNVTYTGGDGNDDVRFYGAVTNSTFDLGTGVNTFTAKNAKDKVMNLTGVTITSSLSAASGDGDYTTVTAGVLKSTAAKASSIQLLGEGANVVNLKSIAGNKATGFGVTIDLGYDRKAATPGSTSDAIQTLKVDGGAKYLDFKSGAGDNLLTFLASVSNSFFDLGDGKNSLTAVNAKGKGQALNNVSITGGDGDSSGDGTTITAGAAKGLTYTGGAGNDTIKLSGAVKNSSFVMGGGENTIEALKNDKGQALTNVGITSGTGSADMTALTFGRLLPPGKKDTPMGSWTGNITINLKA